MILSLLARLAWKVRMRTPLVRRMTPKLVMMEGGWLTMTLVTMEARTSSRERMEDTSEGQISCRETVMQSHPMRAERERLTRIIQTFHMIEVTELERMRESPTIMESPTAKNTTKNAAQSKRTAIGTGCKETYSLIVLKC